MTKTGVMSRDEVRTEAGVLRVRYNSDPVSGKAARRELIAFLADVLLDYLDEHPEVLAQALSVE